MRIDYIEKIIEHSKNYPTRTAIHCPESGEIITYAELEQLSAKVYSYLRSHVIGREKIVMICLPRDARVLVCMIGIWKAGAALVVTDSSSPEEHIHYIRKECQCALVIDEQIYEEMMTCKPLPGFETVSDHDACFAVFTSGSTGTPKGVLHEYGKLQQIVMSNQTFGYLLPSGSVVGLCMPNGYLGTLFHTAHGLYEAHRLVILSTYGLKDISVLSRLITEYKVDKVDLPCSYVRAFHNQLPAMKLINTGGESADALFTEKTTVVNVYGSTEAGIPVASFLIDRLYENTPAGKSPLGLDVFVADEQGRRLSQGEKGEVCFYNEFTRGYIHPSESGKWVFRDRICHMGDLGYFNENGDLMICGRIDNMIKICGNRIYPSEVEAAIRKKLGLKNVVVKGFTEKRRTYLAAFLLRNELREAGLCDGEEKLLFDSQELGRRLSDTLPVFMLPTYYIPMDDFPHLEREKIDVKKLRVPEEYLESDEYNAPSCEEERILCDYFAKTLGLEKVGINDDFFLIGGDSLSAIMLATECPLAITAEQIYLYRTPARLAEHFSHCETEPDPVVENETIPAITPIRWSINSRTNISMFLTLRPGTEPQRFAACVDRVLAHHPVFRMRVLHRENGEYIQSFLDDAPAKTPVIKITDAELQALSKRPLEPCRPNGEPPLYQCFVYIAPTEACFRIEFAHAITDGASLHLLLRQICDCYLNEDTVLPKDNYKVLMLRDAQRERLARERRLYPLMLHRFHEMSQEDAFLPVLREDETTDEEESGFLSVELPFTKKDIGSLSSRITATIFTAALFAYTVAKYNGADASGVLWTYSDRGDKEKAVSAGAFFKDCLILSRANVPISDFLDDVCEQMESTIAGERPSLSSNLLGDFRNASFPYIVYQGNFADPSAYPLFSGYEAPTTSCSVEEDNRFFAEILSTKGDGLLLQVNYKKKYYRSQSAAHFAQMYCDHAKLFLTALDGEQKGR